MSRQSKLRVLSIAHTAVKRDVGRLRYHPFARMREFDVHLVAPRRWREFGRTLHADPPGDPGVTLHLEPILFSRIPAIKWYAHIYPRLGRILKAVKPEIVHLWEEPWSFVALQAALQKGSATLVLEVDQNILKRLPPPFEAIRRRVLRETDLILSRSSDATSVVRACGFEGPVRPIGYGVNQNVFTPLQKSPASDAAPLRIGYFGRLIEEKGLDDALTAMALARAPVELRIMGEGPYGAALRKRVHLLGLEDRVSIQGWGTVSEVADFIRALDATILLTRTTGAVREQFGRAIVESQSCGVPVIGSNCGAIPDVIGEGGWTIKERDPKALALLLDHLAMARHELALRGEKGLQNVASRFTYEKVAHALRSAWVEAAWLNTERSRARQVRETELVSSS